MTTETKKRRTAFDRSYDRARSLQGEITYWVRSLSSHGATFERLMDWRKERVYDHPHWARLQVWAKSEVQHCFDSEFARVDSLLFSTSVFQGRRLLHGPPDLADNAREVYEEEKALEAAGKAAGCWCYAFVDTANGNRLILVPYREDDRQKELTSGRLTQADLDGLYRPERRQLRRGHTPNGQPVPVIDCAVQVQPDGTVELP